MPPLPPDSLPYPADTRTTPIPTHPLAQDELSVLRAVIDSLPQEIYWKDERDRFLGCNQAFAQAVGLNNPEEIVGKTQQDLPEPLQDHRFLGDRDRVVLEHRQPESHTVELPGQPIPSPTWFAVQKTPLSTSDGTTIGLVSTITDITQQIQEEHRLRDAEAELRTLFSAMSDVVLVRDAEGRCLTIAPTNPINLVRSPQEMLGKTLHEVMPQAEADFILNHIHQVLATQTSLSCEYQVVAGKQKVWLAARIFPLSAEKVVLAARDITARKQAEESLRRSESKHRALLSALPDLITRMAADGTYLDFIPTKNFKTALGSSEALGKTIFDVLPRKLAEERVHYIQKALQTDQVQIYEHQIIVRGEQRTEEVRVVTCGPNEVLVIVRDITDRKQVELTLEHLNEDLEARVEERTAALRENEEQLRLILQNMPVMMDAFDNDGNIIMWNNECERVTGYSAEEIIGNPRALEWLYADRAYREQMLQEWASLGNYFRNWEWKIWCKDGTVKTILWSNLSGQFPIPGWGGWGVGIDISDRVLAATALQQSQQLLQLVMDNIPQAIFWKDRQSIYLGCNRRYAQDASLDDPANLVGKTDFDLWKREEAEEFRAFDHRVMASNMPELHRIEPMPEINGETGGWLDINKIPLHDGAGNVVGILGTYEDITERVRAEEILRHSEEHLREQTRREQLLNHLISQIRNSLDFDTILEIALQEVQAFLGTDRCNFARYCPEKDGSYWEILKEAHHPDLPDLAGRYPIARVGGLAQTLLKLEPIKIDDVQCWDQDPALKHLMRRFNYRTLLVMPMQTDAGAIGVISCSHSQQVRHWDDDDIRLLQAVMGQLAIALKQANLYAQTCSKAAELEQALQELKKTQTQMIQSEKMSSLGQLVAGVAHEINNPVNFIYGNLAYAHDYTQDLLELVKLYQQHYPDPVPAVRKEVDVIDLEFLLEDLPKLLQSMKVGADRIQQIVASLRTFSRMDEAEMKAVDIHEGIDSTLMILQHRLKAGNNYPAIAVIKDYGRLPLVECYVGQLNQVFMNILANAIDALEESQARDKPPSNPTDLAASQAKHPPPQIRIQTQACGPDRVSIRITDNGPGIPETVRSRLFDPFFTTKPVGKGTGMGLSISYQIVTERHGGSLVCCSELGQGAEFQIEIPVLQTEPYMI